jgi:UTP--glucose-1-phosphate uridylyltransferase
MVPEIIEKRIKNKMESRGVSQSTVDCFLNMVSRVCDKEPAHVPLATVETPDDAVLVNRPTDPKLLKDAARRGEELLDRVAVIKLNGGRSTTMDKRVPKGILIAKDGRPYLEIVIRQMEAMGKSRGRNIPLVLMDSFFTHGPTLEIISRFDFPVLTFVQNQVPRLVEETLAPLETGTDEDWAPPGHGDVYRSLQQTGFLDRLREQGCKWAFISNLDNLAACLEPWILGRIEQEGIEFLLEVTDRTAVDRKGGTLVVRNGKLDLLEIAQVALEERGQFMDLKRFRVFNTNNVWVDLDALEGALNGPGMALPIIQNRKTIAGEKIIQLETAMGAAIGSFDRAMGLRVDRERFFPTKKVQDLFVLQSDACVLDPMFKVQVNPQRRPSLPVRPRVVFHDNFLDTPLDMHERFEDPTTVSLVEAEYLEISGSVFFERDVKIQGRVVVEAPESDEYRIPRGTVLRDATYP